MANQFEANEEATDDIRNAALWYQQQANLGNEFLIEVDALLAAIAAHPLRFPKFYQRPEIRRALMDRFPYRIFFLRLPSEIIVFRVIHAARHSREWKQHLPKRDR